MQHLPQISEAELEVMKALWQLGKATSAQVLDAVLPGSDWKPKTVQTMLNRLVGKGAVEADKQNGKAYLYCPAIAEADYRRAASQNFLQKLYHGSVGLMLSSFVQEGQLSEAELEELRRILRKEGEQ